MSLRAGTLCHKPDGKRHSVDVVNLGYVLNVIERATERAETIRSAWKLANQLLIISARLTFEARGHLTPFSDGFITGSSTFQKFYEQQELRDWIDATLGETSVAVAPGIFYAFFVTRKYASRSWHRGTAGEPAGRSRIRLSDSLFDKNRTLLEDTYGVHSTERDGYLKRHELSQAGEIEGEALGSIKRAFSIIRRVTGPDDWDRISVERSEDLLVFIALAQFGQAGEGSASCRESYNWISASSFPVTRRACVIG